MQRERAEQYHQCAGTWHDATGDTERQQTLEGHSGRHPGTWSREDIRRRANVRVIAVVMNVTFVMRVTFSNVTTPPGMPMRRGGVTIVVLMVMKMIQIIVGMRIFVFVLFW